MGPFKAIEEDDDVDMTDQPDPTSFISEADLDATFPNRPKNLKPTLLFSDLFTHLFDPINENRTKPRGPPALARAKIGPHGPVKRSPQDERRLIVERFINRWRENVGNDVYPMFRLIIPEKDRERGMYGLKEKIIAKILIKCMRINKDSEDGHALTNWKLPGNSAAARMAGDFAGRCFEILSKRPIRVTLGDMRVDEVNELLDRLSQAQLEKNQIPIFEEFYRRMNPTELMWLIRIILRQMKIGATERTLFSIFHPDAEALFSVSSSLRKVCWTLWDPKVRLEPDDKGVSLMECYQPQLAQFQMHSFDKMVSKMQPTENDREFWIEEKLDGERMQMHMVSDPSASGGKRFAFWSRKAKDYTYLYGSDFHDNNAALTRFLVNAFHPGVENIILDGEMITWDPETDAMVAFGTLKTAALDQAKSEFSTTGHRPLYRIFDILYLNNKPLTNYTLRDRRAALEKAVVPVPRRFEVHAYKKATLAEEIEPHLRKVIEDASEGLVLKNPRSPYRLNERNDDWMKVKPEYMEEFGESLDCIVVGGYYGSGHRGGNLSSFLCGLIVDRNGIASGSQVASNPQKAYSFFKVGGGFRAEDYARIRNLTENKWQPWDAKKPPRDWVELAGGELQYERPDMWIKPQDSVVVQVKAAAVTGTNMFRTNCTLRFPRFTRLRPDKDWTTALSLQEFQDLDHKVKQKRQDEEHKLKVDDSRRKRLKRGDAKKVKVAGGTIDDVATPYAGPATKIFEGLTFYIMSESLSPTKMSRIEIEQLVAANGGQIRQTFDAAPNTLVIADKRVVKVAGMMKRGDVNLIRPKWLFDCLRQSEIDVGKPAFLLPLEPNHMLFTKETDIDGIQENIDPFFDSYTRDVTTDELRSIFTAMKHPPRPDTADAKTVRQQLERHGHALGTLRGWMFERFTLYFDSEGAEANAHVDRQGADVNTAPSYQLELARATARFGGADISMQLADEGITHVVSVRRGEPVREMRKQLAIRKKLPRVVSPDWVVQSWDEETLLDEERFAVV